MFDDGDTGELNATQFKRLLNLNMAQQDHASTPFTEEETSEIIDMLDLNGDGLVDEDELIAFFQAGAWRSEELQESFSRRSVFHRQLVQFIKMLNRMADENAFGLAIYDSEK